jgi:hypothetical protein
MARRIRPALPGNPFDALLMIVAAFIHSMDTS